MMTCARTLALTTAFTLAPSPGCTVSRSTASPTASPTDAGLVAPASDPTCLDPTLDPDRGLRLYYEEDGSWSFLFGGMKEPEPISEDGLCFKETWGSAPGPDGEYEIALGIDNCSNGRTGTTCRPCVDARCSKDASFKVVLQWNGGDYQPQEMTIATGKEQTFPLVVKQGGSGDTADWHVAVSGDPVIKISYQFPVKPVGK